MCIYLYLSIYLSICLSVYLPVDLSIYRSIYHALLLQCYFAEMLCDRSVCFPRALKVFNVLIFT